MANKVGWHNQILRDQVKGQSSIWTILTGYGSLFTSGAWNLRPWLLNLIEVCLPIIWSFRRIMSDLRSAFRVLIRIHTTSESDPCDEEESVLMLESVDKLFLMVEWGCDDEVEVDRDWTASTSSKPTEDPKSSSVLDGLISNEEKQTHVYGCLRLVTSYSILDLLIGKGSFK